MKSNDSVGVTFVNTVIGRGVFNNVVNIQFGTFLFSPEDETSDKVAFDPVTSCRLRMDRICAQQLYEQLGTLLQSIEQQEQEALTGKTLAAAPQEKPN